METDAFCVSLGSDMQQCAAVVIYYVYTDKSGVLIVLSPL